MGEFRPWGSLDWILNKCPDIKWDILGAIATEDRWIASWWKLKNTDRINRAYFTHIEDERSHFFERQELKINTQKRKYIALGGDESDIHFHRLLSPNYKIVEISETFLGSSAENLILDISALPKKFFFPLVKLILKNDSVKNFIVTYTIPRSYTKENLAEDFQDWKPLPLFSGEYSLEKPEIFIAGVGFLTMGVPEQIEKGLGDFKIYLIFPFPPGPPSFQRSWEFVRNVKKNSRIEPTLKTIDAREVSASFDILKSITDGGTETCLLAPYGPKPISLAMCIYACLSKSPVYYTQPISYHPDYSIGISKVSGIRETYAYCLRLNGNDIYTL